MKIQLNIRSHYAYSANPKEIKTRWFAKAVNSVIKILDVYGTDFEI
jgi:hypothetical protein